MRWHTNYHGFGFQADMIARLLDEGFNYVEVLVKATERKAGVSQALRLRNCFSVAHTLFDLFIRRVAGRKRHGRRHAVQLALARAPKLEAPPAFPASSASPVAP
jgi:hypothetical protein